MRDQIKFNRVAIDDNYGVIEDLQGDRSYDYAIVESDEGRVYITSQYFPIKLMIVTHPLGFHLHEHSDDKPIKEYINCFLINNQEVIQAILEYVDSVGDSGNPCTVDRLVLRVASAFSPQATLKIRQDIVWSIMEMLIDMKTVWRNERLGETCIGWSPNIRKHLDRGIYTW